MPKILIIEDERSISDLIVMNLRLVGYDCVQAFDGNDIAVITKKEAPDLVLLDVMIPHTDGFSLMEQSVFGEVPVIFVTAKDAVADRVKGLKSGAEDYIVKPFEAVELLARVEVVLRRKSTERRVFTIEDTSVYLDEHAVTVSGNSVTLTRREFALLEVLIRNRNLALSREKLLDLVWGYDYYGDSRTVDVHIQKLRKKLGWEYHIKTVFKLGYRLEVS